MNYRKKVVLMLGVLSYLNLGTFSQAAPLTVDHTSVAGVQQASNDKKTIKISGSVRDAAGESIIGATILEKGTSNGVVSDMDGNFSMTVAANGILHISYIGYVDQDIAVAGKSLFNIQLLEDTEMLDEVVVIGYGTVKRRDLTGAIASVKGDEVAANPVSNVAQALQGRLPGVNVVSQDGRPGATISVRVRGGGSITQSNDPLYVVDGFPVSNIGDIPASEIESIDVLKDASSTAIYGARAAFGVILVTTKKGMKDTRFSINYSNNFSFSKPSNLPHKATPLQTVQADKDMGTVSYQTGQNVDTWLELLKEYDTNSGNYPDGYAVVDGLRYSLQETDLLNDMMETGFQQTHNISVGGGNKSISYRMSAGMVDQNGILVTDKDSYKRYNISSYIRSDIHSWITPELDIKYANSHSELPYTSASYGIWGAAVAFPSYFPLGNMELDGEILPINTPHNFINLSAPKENDRNDLRIFGKLTITPFKDLKIIGEYTFNRKTREITTFDKKFAYAHGANFRKEQSVSNSKYEIENRATNYNAFNVYANYNKTLGKHDIGIMAGFNQESNAYKMMKASRTDMINEDLPSLSQATGDYKNSDEFEEYHVRGVFYRINYSYAGKYLLETNGRYDGSSKFPKENRFGFFPSVSVGWRVSEEAFFTQAKNYVSNLKLRLSYGSLGNQKTVGYYDYLQLINTGAVLNYAFGDTTKGDYAYESAPNSTDLTWETVITKNIGLDLGFLNNRLNVSFDAYIRDTKDMLMAGKTLPGVYGASSPRMNVADLRTKGWEASITWGDSFTLASKPFNYRIMAGIGDNTSKVTKYDNPNRTLTDPYEGQQLGEIWGYVVDGYFKTDEEARNYKVDQSFVNQMINASALDNGLHAGDLKFVDLDGNNKIEQTTSANDRKDMKVIGNSLPRYNYNLGISADWYGIDFSVLFQGIGKQNWYPGAETSMFWGPYSRPYASFIPSDFMSQVWSEENSNAYFPRPRGYVALGSNRELAVVNTKYLQNLAYCRLKNLSIGYTLPDKWLSKIGFEKIRVYFSGENLLTFTKLHSDYIDPEQASASNSWKTSKSDANIYPWAKTYSFGVDITF